MYRTIGRVLLTTAALLLFAVPIAAIGDGGFDDVPEESVFKADIDWLASVGVTRGCNPPLNTEYCPDSSVTRAQMAAFMHRLADGVVDADTVDGYDADEFAAASHNHDTEYLGAMGKATDSDMLDGMDSSAFALKTDLGGPLAGYDGGNDYGDYAKGTSHKLRTVTINPSADGTAVATYSVELGEGTDGDIVACSVSTTGSFDFGDQTPWTPTPGVSQFEVLTTTRGFDITGGSPFSIELFCLPAASNTSPDTEMRNSNLTVVFVPNP